MSPIHFKRYSPNAADVTVIAERISHWYAVDYNGNHGTTIVLDTGKEVTVGEWPNEVEAKYKSATKAKP